MFGLFIQQLRSLTRTVPTRRRRRSLLAFGDRLEARQMLSAVVMDLTPAPSSDVFELATAELLSNSDPAAPSMPIDEALDLDFAFARFAELQFTATASDEAKPTDSDGPTSETLDEPDEMNTAGLQPLATLSFTESRRSIEVVPTVVVPRFEPPLRPDAVSRANGVATESSASGLSRLDALCESWMLRGDGRATASTTEPRHLKDATAADLTVKTGGVEVINSDFTRLVPLPESRDPEPPEILPAGGTQAGTTTEPESSTQSVEPTNAPQALPEIQADDPFSIDPVSPEDISPDAEASTKSAVVPWGIQAVVAVSVATCWTPYRTLMSWLRRRRESFNGDRQ